MATATRSRPRTRFERLREFSSNAGATLKIDRDKAVIPNVKILGLESRNNRKYESQAVRNAVRLYEGARVNMNHSGGSRLVEDRNGKLVNVRVGNDGGLYGDYHYNPKHHLSEQILWDAENSPENVGFSHNIEGRTRHEGGKVIVEAITKVHSVDLVADPATTKSFFESADMTSDPTTGGDPDPTQGVDMSDPADAIGASFKKQIDDIIDGDGDAKSKVKQIGDILKKQEKILGMLSDGDDSDSDSAAPDSDTPPNAGSKESLQAQLKTMQEKLDRFVSRDLLAKQIERELAESKLLPQAISEAFKGTLFSAKDAAHRKVLIEDRRQATRGLRENSPRSVDQKQSLTEADAGPIKDKADFLRRLKA